MALYGDTPRLEVAYSLNNLASALETAGRYDEAEPLYLRSLAIREALLDAEHPSITLIRNNLGTLYIRSGRAEEAIPLYEDVLAAYRRDALRPMRLASSLSNYAVALIRAGRPAAAVDPLLEAEALMIDALGPESVVLAYTRQSLAMFTRPSTVPWRPRRPTGPRSRYG